MKKKKWLFIALLTLVILLLISVGFAITDKIRYDNGERAIFARNLGSGCDIVIYQGFGYSILYFYPETSSKEESTGIASRWKWFWEDYD